MGDNIVAQLEEASKIVQAPPNLVSNEQRHEAEQVIINFRETPTPYVLCRHILETSNVDYVLFETLNLLRKAIIREWASIPKEDRATLMTYLIDYAMERTLASFVVSKLLQVVAILVKRRSIDDCDVTKKEVTETIEHMIRKAPIKKKIFASRLLSTILQEYSATLKSTDMGLTFEDHFRAKKFFEGNQLLPLLVTCLDTLGNIMKSPAPYPQDTLMLLGLQLKIVDQIFCWGYVQANAPKKLVAVFETIYASEQPSSLRLTNQWKPVMTNPALIRLFFTVHWNVREYPDLVQHSLNCIMQLASLNGPALATREERVRYATNFMENFLQLISSIEIKGQEAYGFGCTLRKFIAFFPPALLAGVPEELLRSMLNCITHLTCTWCTLAIKEEQECADDRVFADAFHNMLEVWVSILQDTYSITDHSMTDYLIQIFDTYLQARLYPPHGVRKEEDLDDKNELQAIGDCTDIKCKFKEQLQSVGLFGRNVLYHSLPLMARLIEQETYNLHEAMKRNQLNPQENAPFSYKVHENLLWLVVIAGHVLSMDSDGEMSLIPAEIMRYSVAQNLGGGVDTAATIETLCSADFNDSLDKYDHAVRLIAAVFRLAEMERQAALVKELLVTISPTLACNIMWFMRRFAACFLLPEEKYYSEISPSLITAIGRDTMGSLTCMNFLFGKIEGNLQCFNFDADIVKSTSDLLLSLIDSKEKAKSALKCDGIYKLVKFVKQESLVLPEKCKRGLYKPLIMVASAIDRQQRDLYWQEIPKPLCDRFEELVQHDKLERVFKEEGVILEIINTLECCTGCALGAQNLTAVDLVRLLYPVMAECAYLVELYHNYREVVEMILEFFCACTRHMLCFLSEVESGKLNTAALEVVKSYTNVNKGRFSIEVAAEENAYEDIILLLELLTGLLSKDYVVELKPNVSQHPVQSTSSTQEFDAADIVLFGLNSIMPLLSLELLKFPRLCLQYYKLITFVCELYPDKVCALPESMFAPLMESVAMGLSELGHEVSILCYDLLEGLACYKYGSVKDEPFADVTLKKFIGHLLNMILNRQISSDALTNAGTTLYALICTYQDEYKAVVENIISSQKDRRNAERLITGFQKMVVPFRLAMDRQEKRKFTDNFEAFVAYVSGFLFVK